MSHKQRTVVSRPASRVAKVLGLVALVAMAATGCSGDEVLRFGWPVGVTAEADRMRELWTWSVVAALVVGVITWALILWPVIAHRKRGDELPRQFQYNHGLEWIYTGVPVVVVVVLFIFSTTTDNFVNAEDPNPDVTVDVMASQWNWEFGYIDVKDFKGSKGSAPVVSDGEMVRTVGNPAEIPLLVLPEGQRIEYRLHSNDVIHSFFVPEFHFKRDVFPYPDKNNQDSTFQNTIDRTGSFVGRCAELCGTYHSQMNFEVRVLPAGQFDQYIQLRTQNNPQTDKPFTAAEALTQMNCGELCTPQAVTTKPFNTDRTARNPSG